MLLETNKPREWFSGKVILDAGCGNGRLTDRFTQLGIEAIGIDFSDSVFRAQSRIRLARANPVLGPGSQQGGRGEYPDRSR